MPRTVEDGFGMLLGWLTPTEVETAAAASHRGSIEAVLKSSFAMTGFFRSGSFGFGTSVSGYSDVDYFAVIPPANLKLNSNDCLNSIRYYMDRRFPLTGVVVDAPAVTVPFGKTRSERHEIIPARWLSTTNNNRVYAIPNRTNGWMYSCPDAQAKWVNSVNTRFGGRLKPLIRCVKAWRYFNHIPIWSYYLEARVTEYALTQDHINLKYDVRGALGHLKTVALANMQDPIGLSDLIYFGFKSDFERVKEAIERAFNQATLAITEEMGGRIESSFSAWDRVYNGSFPGYY